jgi:deoxyribodipyrimidine photolyase-related protein
MSKKIRLVLGDQLNEHHPWFFSIEPNVVYVMMETRSETDYVMHHVQKVCAFFMAMRKFAQRLTELGHEVKYLKLNDAKNSQDICLNLATIAYELNASSVEYQLPDEYRMDEMLKNFAANSTVPVASCDTHHFLTSREYLTKFFAGKKQYLMESFYRAMRRQTGLLMDGDKPLNGKWNFDHENRSVWKGAPTVKSAPFQAHPTNEILHMLAACGVQTFGVKSNSINFPITRCEALELLNHFCDHQLAYFGRYQDAMHTDEPLLFHSMLSFALNVKLISPLEVCRIVEAAYHEGRCDISQAEGFIRQIIGWREYMRGIYWAHMPGYATLNYFEHKNPLPDWFWTGETNMNCLKHAIGQSLETSYAHNIQRLMVIGNFALLAGIHPDELDKWFLGVYADAVEWVQITNTRGMSQFADGGIVGTKPYVSTANYIGKMSNYCSGCKYDAKQKTGDNACPFNALYWDFYIRNREKLANNPRIGMMYKTLDKMGVVEKKEISESAAYVRNHLNEL